MARRVSKATIGHECRLVLIHVATEAGASPRDLARLIGVSESRVNRWLRGEARVPLRLLARIVQWLADIPFGGLEARIATIENYQRHCDAGLPGTLVRVPADEESRAAMLFDILHGRSDLDPGAQAAVLEHFAIPYQATCPTAH